MSGVSWSLTVAILVGSLFILPEVSAQPVTNFVKDGELRTAIEKWRVARELYYSTLYEKPLKITVAGDASEFLVSRYVERRVLPASVIELGNDVLRVAIRMDLETVLNRSFFDEVTERYKSFGSFLVDLTAGKVEGVPIDRRRIQGTLEKENCGVIPCDPTKCNPDTCAVNSVQRSMPRTK